MDQTTLPPPEHFLQLCPVPEKHLILHLFHRVEQLATNFKLLEVYPVISKKSRAMASFFILQMWLPNDGDHRHLKDQR